MQRMAQVWKMSKLVAFVLVATCAPFALVISSHTQDNLATTAASAGNKDAPVLIDGAPPDCADGACFWYNGNFNGIFALHCEENTQYTDARTYDDFNVPDGQVCTVTGVLGEFLADTMWTTARWEIRSGVGLHDGGTIVASGLADPATRDLTGRSGFGFLEYRAVVATDPIDLEAGTYHIVVAPNGNGQGFSNVSATSGANCIGDPCGNNGNSFFDSTFFQTNFEDVQHFISPGRWDFAFGVIGTCRQRGPVRNLAPALFPEQAKRIGFSSGVLTAIRGTSPQSFDLSAGTVVGGTDVSWSHEQARKYRPARYAKRISTITSHGHNLSFFESLKIQRK